MTPADIITSWSPASRISPSLLAASPRPALVLRSDAPVATVAFYPADLDEWVRVVGFAPQASARVVDGVYPAPEARALARRLRAAGCL